MVGYFVTFGTVYKIHKVSQVGWGLMLFVKMPFTDLQKKYGEMQLFRIIHRAY